MVTKLLQQEGGIILTNNSKIYKSFTFVFRGKKTQMGVYS